MKDKPELHLHSSPSPSELLQGALTFMVNTLLQGPIILPELHKMEDNKNAELVVYVPRVFSAVDTFQDEIAVFFGVDVEFF